MLAWGTAGRRQILVFLDATSFRNLLDWCISGTNLTFAAGQLGRVRSLGPLRRRGRRTSRWFR